MNHEKILELADRVEQERPSPELDSQVMHVCGYDFVFIPSYTCSVDDANTLLPSDLWKETCGPARTDGIYRWRTEIRYGDKDRAIGVGWAASEASSICAAVLRARVQREVDRGHIG